MTQKPHCSAVPSRFHVLHLHVKLDWLRENWTVSHSNTRAVFIVSPASPSRYTLAGALYALSHRTQMRAPIVFAYFKLFRGRDAKWSVTSAQWSDPHLSTPLLFSFLSLSLSLSRSRKYADAHGANASRNRYHKWSPSHCSVKLATAPLAHAREHILSERAFSHAYVMEDSWNRTSII